MLTLLKLAVLFGVFTIGACVTTPLLMESCVHYRGNGMLPNIFQDNNPTFPGADYTDTDPATGNSHLISLDAKFEILGTTSSGYMKIYDTGFVEIAGPGAMFNPRFDYDPNGIPIGTARQDRYYAAARWFEPPTTLNTTSFLFSAYYINASAQMSNGIGDGPGKCILQMAAARIDRCDDSPRGTTVIEELVVSTWEITSDVDKRTLFQMALAIDSANKTTLMMIYDDANEVGDGTDLTYFAGYINGGLDGSDSHYNLICNSADNATAGHGPESPTTSAEMQYIYDHSNCRCGTDGTYVFALTANNPSPGDEYNDTVCKDQTVGGTGSAVGDNVCQVGYDDGKTFQRNCRVPVRTEDTCRESARCIATLTDMNKVELTIYVDDPAFTKASFVDYGNATNYQRTLLGEACLNIPITDKKVTLEVDLDGANPCVELPTALDGQEIINWAFEVTDDPKKTVDGNEVIYGSCAVADLPRNGSVDVDIRDIAATMVVTSGRNLSIDLLDRRGFSDNVQVLDGNSVDVRLGREVFIAVCYSRGTPYNEYADPWGIYVTDVWIANNNDNVDDGTTQFATEVVNSTGCKVTPANPETEFFVKSDPQITTDVKSGFDMCQIVGSFEAAKHIGSDWIVVTAKVGFCFNPDIISKCDDSCMYSDADSGPPRARRRRRNVVEVEDTDQPVTLRTSIRIVSGYADSTVTCVERTMALTTIVALIALIVMATVAAILLFVKLQMKKRK